MPGLPYSDLSDNDGEYRRGMNRLPFPDEARQEQSISAPVLLDMAVATQRGCVLYALPEACAAHPCPSKAQHFQTMDCLALVPRPPPTTTPLPALPPGQLQPPGSSAAPAGSAAIPTAVSAPNAYCKSTTAVAAAPAAAASNASCKGSAEAVPVGGGAPDEGLEILVGGRRRLTIYRLPPAPAGAPPAQHQQQQQQPAPPPAAAPPAPPVEVCSCTLDAHHYSLAVSPDGRFVAAGMARGQVNILAYVREVRGRADPSASSTSAAAAAREPPAVQQPASLTPCATFCIPAKHYWGMSNLVRFGSFGGVTRLIVATQDRIIYLFNLPPWDGCPASLPKLAPPTAFLCTGLTRWEGPAPAPAAAAAATAGGAGAGAGAAASELDRRAEGERATGRRGGGAEGEGEEEEELQREPFQTEGVHVSTSAPDRLPEPSLANLLTACGLAGGEEAGGSGGDAGGGGCASGSSLRGSGSGAGGGGGGDGSGAGPGAPATTGAAAADAGERVAGLSRITRFVRAPRPQPGPAEPPLPYPNPAAAAFWRRRASPPSVSDIKLGTELCMLVTPGAGRRGGAVPAAAAAAAPNPLSTSAITGFPAPLNAAVPSPDGAWLAVGCDLPIVYLLPVDPDYRSKVPEFLLPPLPPLPSGGHLAPGCQYLAFNAASDRLAASFDSLLSVMVWDVPHRQLLFSLRHPQAQSPPLALSFAAGHSSLLLHATSREHLVAIDVESPSTTLTCITLKSAAQRAREQEQQQQQQQEIQQQENQQQGGQEEKQQRQEAPGRGLGPGPGLPPRTVQAQVEGWGMVWKRPVAVGGLLKRPATERRPRINGLLLSPDGRMLVATKAELCSFQLLLPDSPWSRDTHRHLPAGFKAAVRALLLASRSRDDAHDGAAAAVAAADAAAAAASGSGSAAAAEAAEEEEPPPPGPRPTGLSSLTMDTVEGIVAAAARDRLAWAKTDASAVLSFPTLEFWDGRSPRASERGATAATAAPPHVATDVAVVQAHAAAGAGDAAGDA